MRRHDAFALALLVAAAAPALASPRLDYMLECQGCHLSDGSGSPGAVPALAGSVARFLAVSGGREYLARVPGVAQSPLGDARLAAVLNWLVTEFGPRELARAAAPYTAAEVAKLRRDPLVDVDTVRATLLKRIAEDVGAEQPER